MCDTAWLHTRSSTSGIEPINFISISVESQMIDDRLDFLVTLPSADEIIVLVIDDNADLVHFYRHHVARTRYQIVHVAEGQRAFEIIANTPPDIIVLDIMLPGVDGWELLGRLREHPALRGVPILVCTILPQERLAMTLGAAGFIRKPISRSALLAALNHQMDLRESRSET